MKKVQKRNYAIYRNGEHICNERGDSEEDAIKVYLIKSQYNHRLCDKEFISKYSAMKAINGFHHHYIPRLAEKSGEEFSQYANMKALYDFLYKDEKEKST